MPGIITIMVKVMIMVMVKVMVVVMVMVMVMIMVMVNLHLHVHLMYLIKLVFVKYDIKHLWWTLGKLFSCHKLHIDVPRLRLNPLLVIIMVVLMMVLSW